MIFSSGIANLAALTGIVNGLGNGYNPTAVTIYGGTKPTASQIISSWASYNNTSPNLLAHYVGGIWSAPNSMTLVQLTSFPSAVLATNSGVGTWCICWSSNYALNNLAATIPTTLFIVGEVSGITGPGIIRFTDTTFTQGVSKGILDSSITVTMV